MFDKQDEDKFEIANAEFNLVEYLMQTQSSYSGETAGILVLPTQGWGKSNAFMPETYDFAKWVRQRDDGKASLSVAEMERTKIADLRSHDLWFPLVYLFSNVSLPVYLNLVSNYIYDKLKGVFKPEDYRISLEVYSEDTPEGQIKRFTYSGSYLGLEKAIKKIDVNKFFD